jgi:hypothetical protein
VCSGGSASYEGAVTSEFTLVGQVLLPPGIGSRGVEVVVAVAETVGEPRDTWILFDQDGRFSETFRRRIAHLTVSTGLRAELHRIEADNLPEINQMGLVDIGVVDLRDRLIRHRLMLSAAEGASQGEVRVAMCFGLPPVGPSGEPIALGSRQFPPVRLGSEMEWLLPLEAQALYFLVERPVGSTSGGSWRGGYQRLFGPFTSSSLPNELIMD